MYKMLTSERVREGAITYVGEVNSVSWREREEEKEKEKERERERERESE